MPAAFFIFFFFFRAGRKSRLRDCGRFLMELFFLIVQHFILPFVLSFFLSGERALDIILDLIVYLVGKM